jgi:hypothetical protein
MLFGYVNIVLAAEERTGDFVKKRGHIQRENE